MAKITITAGNGVRATVRVQELETHVNTIPEVRNSAGELLAAARTETFQSFADKQVDAFASEARSYEIGPKTRLIVEESAA